MKKLVLLIFYLCLFLTKNGYSQKAVFNQIDSLIVKANNSIGSNPTKSIELSNEAYLLSQKVNYTNGKIKSLDNLAYYHYIIRKPDKAIYYSSLQEKEALAIKDYTSVCNALRFKAINYSLLGYHKEATAAIDKGILFAEKLVAPEQFRAKGLLFQSKAFTINDLSIENKRDSKQILKYHKKSIAEFLKIKPMVINDISNLSGEYINTAAEYTQIKENDSALLFFNKALILAQRNKDLSNEHIVLFHIGKVNFNLKKYNEAIQYFENSSKLSKTNKDSYTLRENYKFLDSCYLKLNDLNSSHKYLAKYTKLNDSIITAEKKAVKAPFDEIIKEKEDESANQKRNSIYIIIGIVLFLIAAICFGVQFYKKFKKEREEKEETIHVVVEKESLIKEMSLKVSDSYEEVIELAKNNDPLFVNLFKELYPSFYTDLMKLQPDLSLAEQRFCFYLKLNFTTKEIAEYTFVTPKAIQNRKNRIRKRLGIPENDDIYACIQKIGSKPEII